MNSKSLSKLKNENLKSIKKLLPLAITSGGETIAVLSDEPCDCVGTVSLAQILRGKTDNLKEVADKGCHQVLRTINRFKTEELEIYLRKP